jgi:hypothetical protein
VTPVNRAVATAAELRWAQRLEGFVAGLLPELERLQRLTAGDSKAGSAGTKLDPRIFAPGPHRRHFEATLVALADCGPALREAVLRPPTERLRPVRATVAHACGQLEQASSILRAEVLDAGSPAAVERRALVEASQRADEAVRSLVDGLSTLRLLVR